MGDRVYSMGVGGALVVKGLARLLVVKGRRVDGELDAFWLGEVERLVLQMAIPL